MREDRISHLAPGKPNGNAKVYLYKASVRGLIGQIIANPNGNPNENPNGNPNDKIIPAKRQTKKTIRMISKTVLLK